MSPQDARDADWRPRRRRPGRRPERQQAVIAGVNLYPGRGLRNAVNDAEALADLLVGDFGFDLVGGSPLLDAAATRESLEQQIGQSLEAATESTRWLLFFAGHGHFGTGGEGYLVPVDGCTAEPETMISMTWLVQRCLASRAAECLIVLDACYAGRALRRTEVKPWIDTEAQRPQGSVHLLTASNPFEPALDIGGEGHSVFTQCLLEALDGRLGIHLDDGTVTFSALGDRLGKAIKARLVGRSAPNVLAVALRPSVSGPGGDFRFKPRKPRLASDLVERLRDQEDLRRRRDGLRQLSGKCLAGPEALAEDARLAWNLPLALRLALLDLREPEDRAPYGGEQPPMALGSPVEDEGQEVRAATVRALDELLALHQDFTLRREEAPEAWPFSAWRIEAADKAARRAEACLVHLAVRDPDPDVRLLAAVRLARLLSRAEQYLLGEKLERHRREIRDRLWRRRLSRALVHWPGWRRRLPRHRRSWVHLVAVTDRARGFGRGATRHRVPRRLAYSAMIALVSTALSMLSTYHIGSDAHRALVVRWGLPGFEALPGVGATAVVTDWTETQLSGRFLRAHSPPAGVWLTAKGRLRWGHQLAEQLEDPAAALSLWRLGSADRARQRLLEAAREPGRPAVAAAGYLSLQDPDFVPLAVEVGLSSLGGFRDSNQHQLALQALACVGRVRPARAREEAERLAARLDRASSAELPALVEVLSALGGSDSALAHQALSHAFLELSDPHELQVGRMADSVRRVLSASPGLATQHHADVLGLARRPEQRDRFLGWLEVLTASESGRLRGREVLLEELRMPGPVRAAGLALLGRTLAEATPPRPAELELLEELVGDSDPEVALVAAEVLASLPLEDALASRCERRLVALAADSKRPELALRAVAGLEALGAEDALVQTAQLTDELVRSESIQALIERSLEGHPVTAPVSRALARSFRDPAPWIRSVSAQGILLLADQLEGPALDLYDAAFGAVTASLETPANAVTLAERLGNDFLRADPNSRVRFCRRLARYLVSGETYETFAYTNLLRALLGAKGPSDAAEMILALAPLVSEGGERWMVTLVQGLRAWQERSPEAFHSVVATLLEELTEGQLERRRLAVRMLGPLALRSRASSDSVHKALAQALLDPDPVIAAGAARSLLWFSTDRPRTAGQSLEPLTWALADDRTEVRRAVATSLSDLAGSAVLPGTTLPSPLLCGLEDADPAVRGAVALTFRRWSQRWPERLGAVRPRVLQRLAVEREPAIRARLAATAALLSREDPAEAERHFLVLEAVLDSDSSFDAWAEAKALAQYHPALLDRVLELAQTRRRDMEDQRILVLVLRDFARADSAAARPILKLLAQMLLDEPDRIGWDVLMNGFQPITRSWPERVPEALELIEKASLGLDRSRPGSPPVPSHQTRRLEQAFWSLWVELSVQVALKDQGRLWHGMASPDSGTRQASLGVLVQLVAKHPELRGEVAERLARLRASLRPEVRLAAAQGEEALRVLAWAEGSLPGAVADGCALDSIMGFGPRAAVSWAGERLAEQEAETSR